jgi:hypothetical protein
MVSVDYSRGDRCVLTDQSPRWWRRGGQPRSRAPPR